MTDWITILKNFIKQSDLGDLKTSPYPKEWSDLKMKVSFGMGAPARVPWIAFTAPEMQVSKGFYPVYLYYKDLKTLILAYGISETAEFEKSWPPEIMNVSQTIKGYFDQDVPRYGDSFVFRAYSITVNNDEIIFKYDDRNEIASVTDLETDLNTILDYYKTTASIEPIDGFSAYTQGLFYMEKQLEDFIIHNWENTELGKKYDLIIENGELLSQQYRTDIGPIDILAKDKKTGNFVVIELKKIRQVMIPSANWLDTWAGYAKRKMTTK